MKWLWFYKTPPILVPLSILKNYRGFYIPSYSEYPDLIVPSGKYDICDSFDFDFPETDFDRACSFQDKKDLHLLDIEGGQALVLSSPYRLGIHKESNCIISEEGNFASNKRNDELERLLSGLSLLTLCPDDSMEWKIPGPLQLMSSTEHGENPYIKDSDFDIFKLEAGLYRIDSYTINREDFNLNVYHFHK
ncbi:MAG: hypothetical protein H7A25_24685 [Leptospiraceae bacterium]|nr:hypothetical protein [Leptospiraceae bacterium]MCP5503119.1 hypothetical protein [Leptospiraceae bacterium]